MKQSFYDLNYSDLETVINQNNLNHSAASVLFNWHYKKKKILNALIKFPNVHWPFFKTISTFPYPKSIRFMSQTTIEP